MALFDTDGFGSDSELAPVKLSDNSTVFKSDDFDPTLTDKIPLKVKIDVINSHYNLGKLLTDMGITLTSSTIYCPFHPDEATGHPSAKYHSDSDKLYCFSENRTYSAYDAIKLLYGIDPNKVFRDLWGKLSTAQRREYLDKHNATTKVSAEKTPSEWDKYKSLVLDKFRTKEVDYRQFKNALFKVFQILSKTEIKL